MATTHETDHGIAEENNLLRDSDQSERRGTGKGINP